jgi:hypothetical protein
MRARLEGIPRPVLAGLLLFALTWGIFSVTTQPLTGYEPETAAVAEGLVLEGHLRDDEATTLLTSQTIGRGGRYYARTGLPQPLLEVPFYALGHVADTTLGHFSAFPNSFAFLWFFNPLMAALGTVAFFALVYMTRRSLRWATGLAILFAFASMVWPYSKIGMETTFMALALAAFALAVWARGSPSPSRFALAGLATGAAMATKPYALITIVPIAILLWPAVRNLERERKVRLCAAALAPVFLWIGAIAWYNWYRFGGVTDFGYTESSLTLSAPLNFLGLLFSPGKGLIFYSPLVVLGAVGLPRLWREDRWLTAALLAFLLGLTAVSGASKYWGDEVWGPRYITPAAWTLLVPIAWWADTRMRRRVLVWVACVALAVQVVGVAVEYGHYMKVARALTGVPLYRDREGVPLERIPYGDDPTRWIPGLSPILVQTEGLISSQLIEPLTGKSLTISYTPFEGPAHSVDLSESGIRMPLDFWWSAAPRHKGLACALAFLILVVSAAAGAALYRVVFGRPPARERMAPPNASR